MNLPDFFLEKNLVKRGKYTVPPRKNPVKNTGFFPQYSAPKRHSSLFLRMLYVGTRTFPSPGPVRSGPGPHPGPALPARSSCLAPATGFFSQSRFFFRTFRIFPSHEVTREKFGTKGENSLTTLRLLCPSRHAAPRRIESCA